MNRFDAGSTTDQVIAGISLQGKCVVVTGASSGLGQETCRVLAAAGATVLMVARNKESLEGAALEIRQQQPEAQLLTQIMDLADLDSVRSAAAAILQQADKIQLLINNAGVMACPLMRTAQGFEMQFGTNHLGHFLLTALLSPALIRGAPCRVINLSSAGHKFGPFNFDDPDYRQREYDKWQAYGESKTANILFSVELDRRMRERGVRAFAVHPGMIMTNLARHLEPADITALMDRSPSSEPPAFKTVEQGAATSVWAAAAAGLAAEGGLYLEDCQIATAAAGDGVRGFEHYAIDSAAAEQLWLLSENLVGQPFAST
ncbi:MAG: SDR family NAD(P)-dependent oxidoreductase [Halioglobus sp.]|nr:SDR family NAD(P)-dependent oxidoreductase [Halioglobus sp.]